MHHITKPPRRLRPALCFSARLFAQGCVTFTGTKISAPLFDGSTLTFLLQQPGGSYSAVTLKATPPYNITNVAPNFDQSIGSCTTAAGTLVLPSVSQTPAAPGSSSSVVEFGELTPNAFLSGVLTTTPSPQPYASVGLVNAAMGTITQYPVPEGAATALIADFNEDHILDLAVVYTDAFSPTQQPGGVAILLGNSTITSGLGQNPASVIAYDFNGDGQLDLATANESGTVSIMLGNGDGTFGAPHNFPAGSDCADLAAGDFNKDGKLDLALDSQGKVAQLFAK